MLVNGVAVLNNDRFLEKCEPLVCTGIHSSVPPPKQLPKLHSCSNGLTASSNLINHMLFYLAEFLEESTLSI